MRWIQRSDVVNFYRARVKNSEKIKNYVTSAIHASGKGDGQSIIGDE